MVATGKPGLLYLLDQTNLGKFNSIVNQDLQEVNVQSNAMGIVAGVFSQPAYWNGNFYTAAIADFLKQFRVASGTISATPQSQSAKIYNRRGGAPVVSAKDTTDGVVWVVDISAYPTVRHFWTPTMPPTLPVCSLVVRQAGQAPPAMP